LRKFKSCKRPGYLVKKWSLLKIQPWCHIKEPNRTIEELWNNHTGYYVVKRRTIRVLLVIIKTKGKLSINKLENIGNKTEHLIEPNDLQQWEQVNADTRRDKING
jgi:hypothetical protein